MKTCSDEQVQKDKYMGWEDGKEICRKYMSTLKSRGLDSKLSLKKRCTEEFAVFTHLPAFVIVLQCSRHFPVNLPCNLNQQN